MALRMLKKILLLAGLGLVMAATAFANVPTIAVEELKPGMTGYGKTVFHGTQIETFDVEILGVTGSETGGYNILIKASGPNLERNGGISQGMSGSPVYINGRLAGAVAYGQAFSDPNYCFLTPINQMLEMLNESDPRPSVFRDLPEEEKSTPLMVSGFSADGLAHLNETLKPFGLTSYAVPAGTDNLEGVTLEPGSSVGVSLVRGDMNIGAIGTVTWVGDDGHVLAFGHPFLQHGKSDYFMTNAYIFAAVPNIQSAFKVGSLGNTLGHFTEDRLSGVAGKLDENAKIIPMYVSVTDMDRGIHHSTNVQLVTDEDLVPTLVDGVTYNAVSIAKDRKGGGTSRIRFTVTAQGEKEGPIRLRRENMFYSSKDIGKVTNSELNIALDMLMNNRFDTVKVFDVNVDVETSSQCEVAELVSASFPREPVPQGGDLPITLTFKPYRSKEFTRTIHFKVPDKQKPGPMNLIVRSGNATQWLQNALSKRNHNNNAEEQDNNQSMANAQREFRDFLNEFNTMDANNEIVVDLAQNLDAELSRTSHENEKGTDFAAGLSKLIKGSKYKQKYTMDFIISGETSITAEVKGR
jgi:hypothetical protein